MGCIALVRCVLVLRFGLAGVVWCGIRTQAGVVWYPYAGWGGVVSVRRLGWCGIRMQAEALFQPAYGYHTTPAKPQRNTNTHRTRAIQPMK